MSKILSTVIFYSKNFNVILAKQIKDTLSKINIFTLYMQDIDDIILKKLSTINCLILDFTSCKIDERSFELLLKLKSDGYIKNIIIITNDEDINYNDVKMFNYNENFEKDILNYFNTETISLNNKKIFDSTWVTIVGDYLAESGISPKYCGYILLVDSIIFYLNNNCVVKNLGKILYPYLANKHQISIASVEMRLRTSISKAYSLNRLKCNYCDNCPTIKEFIIHSLTQIYSKIYQKDVINF